MFARKLHALIFHILASTFAFQVVAETRPLHLVLGELPPYNCPDLAGQPRCINNKIAAKIQHNSDLTLQISLVPYARASRMLYQQQADVLLLMRNDDVLSLAEPLIKLYEVKMALYTTHSVDASPSRPVRLGRLRGIGSDITSQLGVYQQVELLDYDQGIEMLALGRLDAIFGPEDALQLLLQRHGLTEKVLSQPILQLPKEVWLYCRHQACSAEQQQQLQQAMQLIDPYMPLILQRMPLSYYQ